ncbi:MAG: Peptidase family C25 [Planctomycetes bacterium ADurb.Bin069]|nr:MAG: Peptidase family C25 [Planctomycetes bacterium ADurb.Bin069]
MCPHPRALPRSIFPRRGALVLAACVAAAGALGQTVRFITRFDPADLILRETIYPPAQTKVTSVRMRGASHAADPGFPILPFVTRRVAVPAGAKLGDLIISVGQVTTMGDHPVVQWQQGYQAGDENRRVKPPEFLPDEDGGPLYYPAEAHAVPLDPSLAQYPFWPPAPARIRETTALGGYDMVTIDIYPVTWRPREKILQAASSITVGITSQGGTTPRIREPTYVDIAENEELRAMVVNADDLVYVPRIPFYKTHDVWYLIITDNKKWNEDMTPGAAVSGDMVAQFERLAAWKTSKGKKAAVVTVEEIMNRDFGVFDPPGTRDLQEVIRNFLKHARSNWNTYWVLLGGDVSIIPPRMVTANVTNGSHYIWLVGAATPEEDCCYYDAATQFVRIHHRDNIDPGTLIVSQATGRSFARVANPSAANPGWQYVTSETYATPSAVKTVYIRLAGPAADIQGTDFYAALDCNTIPTDLYYSSLLGRYYGQPGRHDWDLNDNGLYGQYNNSTSLDGVAYWPNMVLGRAPVESGAEAKAFVDKTIAYEKFDGLSSAFVRKLLLGSSNWGGGPAVEEAAADPPVVNKYYYAAAGPRSKCYFKSPVDPSLYELVAYNAPGDYWHVPYNRDANAMNLGYYFCENDSFSTRSEIYINFVLFEIEIPLPTPYVLVRGPAARIRPAKFFFDSFDPDSSVVEKEQIKDELATLASQLTSRRRLYQDWEDTPGYPASDLFELSRPAMKDALESGYNIISLSGHGNARGCAGVDRADVASLTNGFRGGAVYAESCSTARFDDDDCVAEHFVKTAAGGAVAYVGNSRFSWVGYGDDLEREFWEGLLFSRNVGHLHNRKAVLADNGPHRWAQFALNLMGDPELSLWIKPPARLVVEHAECVLPSNALAVRARDAAGAPVNDVRFCLTGPAGQFALALTDAEGRGFLSTSGYAYGDVATLVAVADAFIPYEGRVKISLCANSRFVRGDTNNDGRLNIADAIHLLTYLFDTGEGITCDDAADVNDDGKIDIGDPIKMLAYLFAGDRLPPGTTPGQIQEDPTPDQLDCIFYGRQ